MAKFITNERRSIDGGQLEAAKDAIGSCDAGKKKRIKTTKLCFYSHSYSM